MTNYITVSGAYGRDYKSLAAAKLDWESGKDFIIRDAFTGGLYINNQDYANITGTKPTIMVRYSRDRKIGRIQ